MTRVEDDEQKDSRVFVVEMASYQAEKVLSPLPCLTTGQLANEVIRAHLSLPTATLVYNVSHVHHFSHVHEVTSH